MIVTNGAINISALNFKVLEYFENQSKHIKITFLSF